MYFILCKYYHLQFVLQPHFSIESNLICNPNIELLDSNIELLDSIISQVSSTQDFASGSLQNFVEKIIFILYHEQMKDKKIPHLPLWLD